MNIGTGEIQQLGLDKALVGSLPNNDSKRDSESEAHKPSPAGKGKDATDGHNENNQETAPKNPILFGPEDDCRISDEETEPESAILDPRAASAAQEAIAAEARDPVETESPDGTFSTDVDYFEFIDNEDLQKATGSKSIDPMPVREAESAFEFHFKKTNDRSQEFNDSEDVLVLQFVQESETYGFNDAEDALVLQYRPDEGNDFCGLHQCGFEDAHFLM